jgi:hypothetical protein
MSQSLTIVWVDHVGSDWLALYVDGAKVYEGHPPDLAEGLERLTVPHEERVFPSARLADLGRMRGLPRELTGVPR